MHPDSFVVSALSMLYKLFVCLLDFLLYFHLFPYTFFLTIYFLVHLLLAYLPTSRIDTFCFQAGGCRRILVHFML